MKPGTKWNVMTVVTTGLFFLIILLALQSVTLSKADALKSIQSVQGVKFYAIKTKRN